MALRAYLASRRDALPMLQRVRRSRRSPAARRRRQRRRWSSCRQPTTDARSRALVDELQRAGARRADRRGARQQPRPAGRDGAHRRRARAGDAGARPTFIRALESRRQRRARSAYRESAATPIPSGFPGDEQRLPARAQRVVRARPVGQVPRRDARRAERPARDANSRARRCAPSSRPKSRARISACSRPTRSCGCCATR